MDFWIFMDFMDFMIFIDFDRSLGLPESLGSSRGHSGVLGVSRGLSGGSPEALGGPVRSSPGDSL